LGDGRTVRPHFVKRKREKSRGKRRDYLLKGVPYGLDYFCRKTSNIF